MSKFDYKRGAKSGAKAGITSSFIATIFFFFFFSNSVTSSYYSYNYYYNPLYLFIPSLIMGIIGGAILGVIVGLIFARIYSSLPGSTSKAKAVVLCMIFWFFFNFIISSFFWYGMYSNNGFVFSNIFTGIIQYLLFGFLLSKFWEDYGEKYSYSTLQDKQFSQSQKTEYFTPTSSSTGSKIHHTDMNSPNLSSSSSFGTSEEKQIRESIKDIDQKMNELESWQKSGDITYESYKKMMNDFKKAKKEKNEKILQLKHSKNISKIQKRIDALRKKNESLDFSEITSLIEELDYSKQKKAEKLLDKIEEQYEDFKQVQNDIKDIRKKKSKLTDQLADGKLDSTSYKRALDDLDKILKEKENTLWNLHNQLFKEEYEKPF